ncbi:DUF4336 domain-containing protein [Photobacterium aphoticum]|uniref:Methanol oxidase, glmU n=1 Tax=Photobacterium aphoticum TaxID=754436 RepID=A0A0J1GQ05_9GAMM|nr:DUF4336 domain-containing protein [Photobacterium aphoticum]KLV01840.1 methanol oxidase, glmU [Photobacterium aphoticum]PSU60070.1 DUF4336 domain-containing protein [Photobacterium aphoticum]GHA32942.1 hypothetical protein GCM10007086_02670 [Photobacterium aphoticum]
MIEWSKDRLWYVDMPFKLNGIPVGARMTIIRLENGQLLIHSPIQLTTQLQLTISQLGAIQAIVTPNMGHHLFLSEWWLAYPQAYFFAPPGLEQKRTDLVFDDALSATSPDLWQFQLYQTLLRGSDKMEEVIFCDPLSNTLIVGDTLSWLRPTHNLLTLALGIANGCYFSPALPYYWRRTFQDKTRLRQSLQEILTWPFDRIILSHGQNIEQDGKLMFYEAFKWAFEE